MNTLILGMHRSGTSCITRLLVEMGFYFGPKTEHTAYSNENPLGFWERRDTRRICDYILQSEGNDWWKISDFNVENIKNPVLREASRLLNITLTDLNNHSNWILKEPRLCLLWPFFEKQIPKPFYVVTHRNPFHIANSLKTRNNFNFSFSLHLWEKYMLSALKALKDKNYILINYDNLVDTPIKSVNEIYEKLIKLNAKNINLPSENTISEIIQNKLRRSDKNINPNHSLTKEQKELLCALSNEENLPIFLKKQNNTKLIINNNTLYEFEIEAKSNIYKINPIKIASNHPKIDINIVTYNDADNLEDVLFDVSNQTYKNININIFDDCSTDRTKEIIDKYVATEPRSKISQNTTNFGLVRNFNKALFSGSEEYIIFKSGNDRIEKTFVEKLYEMVRANPDLGLAYAKSQPAPNSNTNYISYPNDHYFRTNNDSIESACLVMQKYTNASPLWGIYKKKILDLCRPYQNIQGGDHILICEMSLYASIDFYDELLLTRHISNRTPLGNSLIHCEDISRNLQPNDILHDQSYRVSYLLLIYEHVEMIYKSRIDRKAKEILSKIAVKILKKRFQIQIENQIEKFYAVITSSIKSLDYKNCIATKRFLFSILIIIDKCLQIILDKRLLQIKQIIENIITVK